MLTEALIAAIYVSICHMLNKRHTTFASGQFQTWIVAAVGVLFARHYSVHSGGCMNPSVAIGLNLIRYALEGPNPGWQYLYVYVVFPILGSLVGTLFFDYIFCRCLPKKITKT